MFNINVQYLAVQNEVSAPVQVL